MLSTRELQVEDIGHLVDYWTKSDPEHLKRMGVDLSKMPSVEDLTAMLNKAATLKYEEKQSYCIIWEIDKIPVGHSNVNRIVFGEHASMHLHLWNEHNRKSGNGLALVAMSLPFFFKNLKLKMLYCEPYALNPAPNRTLEKLGFIFQRKYLTVPGFINFEQEVNRWEMSVERFRELFNK